MSRIPQDLHIGSIHQSNNYGEIKIINYRNKSNVDIIFINTGFKCTVASQSIRRGAVKDLTSPIICGVGFLGDGKYKAAAKHKNTSAYKRWHGMISRCYNPSVKCYSCYGAKGVKVSEEWHNFQAYAAFYYDECERLKIDPENNKHELDKDINSIGDLKIYSAHCCSLISKFDNISEAKAKSFMFTNPSGVITEIYNLSQFCKDNKLNRGCMQFVYSGKYKSHKGWRR